MKTIPDVARETLIIEEYLKDINPGTTITYSQIEQQTGVAMDNKGKKFLGTALKRLKLEKETIYGQGIVLSSPHNATRIVTHRLVKVDNAVKRAEKTHKNINSKFYNELNPEEQKKMTYIGAAFGAIRVAADMHKKYIVSQKIREPANGKQPRFLAE